MASIVVLSGSPSSTSRTAALTRYLAALLDERGHRTRVVDIRAELPAEALIGADTGNPEIAAVVAAIQSSDGILVASAVYKAAYTGVLKLVLDLLPHQAFAGKVVLPLLTGAGEVHTLALDYALRPVLAALGSYHVVPGLFVVDKDIERTPDGITLTDRAKDAVRAAVDTFDRALTGVPTPARDDRAPARA